MLKLITLWSLVVLGALTLPVYAATHVLTTAVIVADRVTCLVSNGGTKTMEVTVQIIGPAGITTFANQVLQSGGFSSWGAGSGDALCRFIFSKGSAADARATACGISTVLGEKCAAVSEGR